MLPALIPHIWNDLALWRWWDSVFFFFEKRKKLESIQLFIPWEKVYTLNGYWKHGFISYWLTPECECLANMGVGKNQYWLLWALHRAPYGNLSVTSQHLEEKKHLRGKWVDNSAAFFILESVQITAKRQKFSTCLRQIDGYDKGYMLSCSRTYWMELWADTLPRTGASLSAFTLHLQPLPNRWPRFCFYINPHESVTTLACKTQHRLK